MNGSPDESISIVVEREMRHPPEKIWRALTEPYLIGEWLMKSGDFRPVVGHGFGLVADWGAVDCRVETVEPNRSLSYSWDTKDLRSTVTWTLTPTDTGTLLRMEQEGFRSEQKSYYRGAQAAWPRFLAALDEVAARLE